MQEQPEVLSEFEGKEIKTGTFTATYIFFACAILVYAWNFIDKHPEFKATSFFNDPTQWISSILLFLVPLIILILFVIKKKSGWILMLFYSLIMSPVIVGTIFLSYKLESYKVAREQYFYHLFIIVTVVLLLTASVREYFKIGKKMFLISFLISLLFATGFLVFIIFSISKM